MKNLKKAGILVILFFVTFYASKALMKADAKDLVQKDTDMVFSKDLHDFSEIEKDKEVSTYFVYENKGDFPLKIENIDSRCGCTIPYWSREEIAPNQKDSILVKYDSKKEGYFSKSVYIISNSKTSPDVLYIKGTVVKEIE